MPTSEEHADISISLDPVALLVLYVENTSIPKSAPHILAVDVVDVDVLECVDCVAVVYDVAKRTLSTPRMT